MEAKKKEPSFVVPQAITNEDKYQVPNSISFLPPSWIPYAELMRLDRPAGFFAFYWHYIIGLSFAACISPEPPLVKPLLSYAIYLVVWVVILRGAVCTLNDILDQDFDRRVARTRYRPIARGAVTTLQGYLFAMAQVAVGIVLSMPFPRAATIYATLMTAILSVYPLAKRVSDFPQVLLGFGLAMPVFLCCAALETDSVLQPHVLTGSGVPKLIPAELCMYGAGVLWTIIFDTIYAHQDIKDDKKVGVRSLAIRLGGNPKPALAVLACLQSILLMVAGFCSSLSSIYYIVGCGGASISLLGMVMLVQLDSVASCAWWFGPGSRFVGTSVTLGLLGEYVRRLL